MKHVPQRSGAAIATAVASLLLTVAIPMAATHADAKGKCMGANACKGKSACSIGANGCSGSNACKGKGYLMLTKEECDKIRGTTFVAK
jgi:hypothetical protein